MLSMNSSKNIAMIFFPLNLLYYKFSTNDYNTYINVFEKMSISCSPFFNNLYKDTYYPPLFSFFSKMKQNMVLKFRINSGHIYKDAFPTKAIPTGLLYLYGKLYHLLCCLGDPHNNIFCTIVWNEHHLKKNCRFIVWINNKCANINSTIDNLNNNSFTTVISILLQQWFYSHNSWNT